MSLAALSSPDCVSPYSPGEIRRRIDACPKLASLQSINRALAGLVNSESSYNSQIAEIIRRDPSLTARLMRMVNSVYFGLSAKVNQIEEAVLYLGLRQIRELSMATPVIEELERLSTTTGKLPWINLWKHSIGTAILTREILGRTSLLIDDDTDYIGGLLHDVGKVIMATQFPGEFARIIAGKYTSHDEVCAAERALIGWDHAQIGGHYLERHQLSEEIVEAVRHHNAPEHAERHPLYAAAVQVADMLVRHAGVPGGLEDVPPVAVQQWHLATGWNVLFGDGERERQHAQASLGATLARLPGLLSELV